MPNLDNSEIKFDPAGTESKIKMGGVSLENITEREFKKEKMTATNEQEVKWPVSTELEQGEKFQAYPGGKRNIEADKKGVSKEKEENTKE